MLFKITRLRLVDAADVSSEFKFFNQTLFYYFWMNPGFAGIFISRLVAISSRTLPFQFVSSTTSVSTLLQSAFHERASAHLAQKKIHKNERHVHKNKTIISYTCIREVLHFLYFLEPLISVLPPFFQIFPYFFLKQPYFVYSPTPLFFLKKSVTHSSITQGPALQRTVTARSPAADLPSHRRLPAILVASVASSSATFFSNSSVS